MPKVPPGGGQPLIYAPAAPTIVPGASGLPASFAKMGLVPPSFAAREGRKLRRLTIACDGPPDSGKTEFALSAPGPGGAVALDRGFEALFDNPTPPKTRQKNWGVKVIKTLKQGQATKDQFVSIWKEIRDSSYAIAESPDVRTLLVDGDTDSWEIHRLGEFGTLTKIPPVMYDTVNSQRRGYYMRLWDSGKIVIITNRVRKKYVVKIDDITGLPVLNDNGKEVREWDGTYERQGFQDIDYAINVNLMHYRVTEGENAGRWGFRIMKCKSNSSVIGMELEGDDCCFQGLVQTVFPQIPLSEWGY